MNATLAALLGALAGGVALAVQSAINGRLGRGLQDPVAAACVSFGAGFLVLAVLSAPRLQSVDWRGAAALPWWAWIGGTLGALYVVAIVVGVSRLGVLTTAAAVVFGQIAAALLLDALGAFGLPVQGVSWQRLLAAALILAGLVLSRYP